MPRRPWVDYKSNNNNNNTYGGGNVYGPKYGNNGSPWGITLANNPLQLWQPPARNNVTWPPYSYPPARRIQYPPIPQSSPTFNIPVPVPTVPYPQYIPIPALMPDPYWYDDDDDYWDAGCSDSTVILHQCRRSGGRRRSRRRGGIGLDPLMGYGGGYGGFDPFDPFNPFGPSDWRRI